MARAADVIEDSTVLDGPRIDVPARIGWLLRTARVHRGVSLRALSVAMSDLGHPLSVPALSVAERTGVRDGVAIDCYEVALGLPEGRLRAPVDVLCRSFDYAPRDRAPAARSAVALALVDATFEPVLSGRAVGGQWLRWARLVCHGTGVSLPSVVVAPLALQLVEELVRAVGPAHISRYEAVAQLRCGPYADLVEDATRDLVRGPGPGPALVNAFAALAEQPSPRLLAWCGSLLEHPAECMVGGACVALEGMRSVGGLDEADWEVLVEPLVRALQRRGRGHPGPRLAALVRMLPVTVRHEVRRRLGGPLAPLDGPRASQPGPAGRHLALCRRIAADACDRLEVEHQPLLTRMLLEVLYDSRGPRAATSAWLLMATPFVEHLLPPLLGLVESPPDRGTSRAALRAVRHLQLPTTDGTVAAWLARSARWEDDQVLAVAGNAGVAVPGAHQRVREAGPVGPRLVETLGMASHPDLVPVAGDPSLPDPVRDAARWWLRTGPRVVD